MLRRIIIGNILVLAGFHFQQLFAQQNEYPSKRIFLGFEPILHATGELGGYADLALGDKMILHGYFAWHHWYWNNSDEVEQ
jgi:hypothetical protein